MKTVALVEIEKNTHRVT